MDKFSDHLHVQWEGPFSYEVACNLRDEISDYGVYQIYGTHPVYGSDVLLYIGKADNQTFGKRLAQHDWHYTNQDSSRITVYVGRLCGYKGTPSHDIWSQQIASVERLLIYSHWPAGNSSGLNVRFGNELHHTHVLNWGQYRDLMAEVSGARYSDRYDSVENYEQYSAGEV
jgi:hypothetical protein